MLVEQLSKLRFAQTAEPQFAPDTERPGGGHENRGRAGAEAGAKHGQDLDRFGTAAVDVINHDQTAALRREPPFRRQLHRRLAQRGLP